MDGAFRSPLTKALYEAKDKVIDAIKLRSADDKWTPTNLKSKTNLARYLQEYTEINLPLESYVTGKNRIFRIKVVYDHKCLFLGGYWLQLTNNTLAFTKLFLSLVDDCLKLQNSDLLFTIDEIVMDVFDAQIKHFRQVLRNETHIEQRQFIIKNAEFLLVSLLNLAQEKYNTTVGFKCPSLERLQKENLALTHGVTPSNRQIPKYSSNEYL